VNCYFGRKESTPHPQPLSPSDAERVAKRGGAGGASRHQRSESERFKCFTCDELLKRDKVNLDIFWLKDDALEESANLPAPEIIAADIATDLEAALEQFATIAGDLKS
jgi:type I restriction enzyme M protein